MKSKNGIYYTKKRAIKRSGRVIGWHLYTKGGLFNGLVFRGYLWRTPTGNARKIK